MAYFKNPQNGYIEEGTGSLSLLWCLPFGPLLIPLNFCLIQRARYAPIEDVERKAKAKSKDLMLPAIADD